MGHIELAAPVSHIWYFKGIPSRMGLILDMSPKELEKVLYFASYVVLDPGDSAVTGLHYKEILSEQRYHEVSEQFPGAFKAGMGAESVQKLLEDIKLDELSVQLKKELENASSQKMTKLVKRLRWWRLSVILEIIRPGWC